MFFDIALWWQMRYVFYLRCGLMSMITPSPSRDSRKGHLGNTGGNTPSHMWTSRLGRYVGMHHPRDELSHSIWPLMVDQFGKQPSFKPAVNRSEISPNRIRVMLLAGGRIQCLGGSGGPLVQSQLSSSLPDKQSWAMIRCLRPVMGKKWWLIISTFTSL